MIAIVILNWNGKTMLEKYLPCLIKNTGKEAEIYVADNASTDDSLEWIANNAPQVKTIRLEKNWGFAEGYNKALKNIDAEYYLLLNSDVEVTEGWLEPMLSFMESNPEAAVCQPKIMDMYDRNKFEYSGACGGYLDKHCYPFCRGRILNVVEEDHGQYDTVFNIAWASGACFMIRKKDYWETGGLDGRFFAHNEEIDLCWRLRMKGRKIFSVPMSKVYHVGGATLPKSNPQKTYLNFRNNLTMIYKNAPQFLLGRVMRERLVLDYIAALTFLFKGKKDDFLAVIRARRDFHKWKHSFDKDREEIQKTRVEGIPTSWSDFMYFSILWRFYVNRQKTFKELFQRRTPLFPIHSYFQWRI